MGYIRQLTILGLRKFEEIEIEFNKSMYIIVGENEAGKSTILEAISIVLNQQYKNMDKSIIKELMNKDNVDKFLREKRASALPKIQIEVKFEMTGKERDSQDFFGEESLTKKEPEYGILFECKFDEECTDRLAKEIGEGKIPYEYYVMSWMTFRGVPYKSIKKPFNSIFIDTSAKDANNSFNYFNRALFSSKYVDTERMNAKNSFRSNLEEAFNKLSLPDIDVNRKFGINDKKVILEAIISVFEDGIPLENKGSGMESLIKTHIALDRSKSNLDVIFMEEPENHLCFSNMNKMLDEIVNKRDSAQIILTTHSNMIASRLDLRNVLWIKGNHTVSLADIDDKVARFFTKADDNSFLQLLLSEKIILVEGATEYLLLPDMFRRVAGKTLEEAKVVIISCNGVSYKNYLKIAKKTGKRIAVITDNDKNPDKIRDMIEFNSGVENINQHIFMDNDVDNWTWEKCIYDLNKSYLDRKIKVEENAEYLFHGENYGKVLGKMLNNKVAVAYYILESKHELVMPKYVEDAIKWING